MVNRFPRWQITGQHAPGTTTLQKIENAIQYLSCASHVRVDDPFSLRLTGMVGFSTIVYHSGRLGKFVVIWSSSKFAQPLLFDKFSDTLLEALNKTPQLTLSVIGATE